MFTLKTNVQFARDLIFMGRINFKQFNLNVWKEYIFY